MATTFKNVYAYGISLTGTSDSPIIITGQIEALNYSGLYSSTVSVFAGAVENYGTVTAPDAGIDLGPNVTVTNDSTGTIAGGHYGVVLRGGVGTVTNDGTISGYGSAGIGVYLADGGIVTNGTISPTASIYGVSKGVYVKGAPGTVVNYGTIASANVLRSPGILLAAGGDVTNTQLGTITGGVTVQGTATATIDNAGQITGFKYSDVYGVHFMYGVDIGYFVTDATIVNSGTISGITAFNPTTTSLSNTGTITGTDYGAVLGSGTVTNTTSGMQVGYITGARAGVAVTDGAGNVSNLGTIKGTGTISDGIVLRQGGVIVNGATNATGALIEGTLYGVVAGYQQVNTLINYGTIEGAEGVLFGYGWPSHNTLINAGTILGTGGTAVQLGSGRNLLVDDPGAVFGGTVFAGNARDTLELAAGTGIGTLAALGSSFAGFGTLSIASGATWGVTGSFGGYVKNSGTLLTTPSLYLTGTVVNAGSLEAPFYLGVGGYLTNLSSGTISGQAQSTATSVITAALVDAGNFVDNAGYIANTSTYANSRGVLIQNTSSFSNSGTILGYGGGLEAQSNTTPTIYNYNLIEATGNNAYAVNLQGGGTVTNSGTILATSAFGTGLIAKVGGLVTNEAGGTISGLSWGVEIFDSPPMLTGVASVVNAGLIEATDTGGFGVGVGLYATTNYLYNAGTITGTESGAALSSGTLINTTSGRQVGYIAGASYGVVVTSGPGTVSNFGTIAGTGAASYGIELQQGGAIVNDAPGGLIEGTVDGVLASGQAATLTNYGMIYATGGVGVGAALNATTNYLYNTGTITGMKSGAELSSGTLTNSTSYPQVGYIAGASYGVLVTNGAGTVNNLGTIEGTGSLSYGIDLKHGGLITNGATNATGALIEGGTGGVYASNEATTLINYGTIEGTEGVYFASPSDNTLINAGTILGTGGIAVQFGTGNNRLIVDPGATFGTGYVYAAGGGTNTLELAAGSNPGALNTVAISGTVGYVGFSAIIVDAGAHWSLGGSNSVADGTPITIDRNATFDITGNLTGAAAFALGGGTLILANTPASTDTFNFADTPGTIAPDVLTLSGVTSGSGPFSNAITGFDASDQIVLPGITFAAGSAPIIDTVDNTVTIALQAGGDFVFSDFAFNAGAPTTLTVGGDYIQDAPCFLTDSLIMTERGEVPVQDLVVGQIVLTASGEAKPIIWIGTGRKLVTRGHRSVATPVIVRKGALADNVPHHDLRITKGHALFVDDVLIPVEFLVNHRSILWDDRAQEVTYFHIELGTHDVLLANGAEAESYRDDGNRWLFANANSGWGRPPKPHCAPVRTGGSIVDTAWQRLLDRAGPRPGLPLTDEADLHLLVDGTRVDGKQVGTSCYFHLSRPASSVRVVSRAGAPAEMGLSRDPRVLGVALTQIVVRQGKQIRIALAEDPTLDEGFHGFEPALDLRWTNGDGLLPAALFEGFSGRLELVLHVGGTARYPLFDETEQRAAA